MIIMFMYKFAACKKKDVNNNTQQGNAVRLSSYF